MGQVQDVRLAHALDHRIANLEQADGWTVECRAVFREETSTVGMGTLLGRLLLGCEASFVWVSHSAVSDNGLASTVPTNEMPLILPGRQDMENAGLPAHYSRPCGQPASRCLGQGDFS